MWGLGLLIGGVFAPIAATMAFVIIHEELGHHPLARGEILKKSLHMAGVTFVFFMLASIALGPAWALYWPRLESALAMMPSDRSTDA